MKNFVAIALALAGFIFSRRTAFADTFVLSDTEGSTARIDTYVREGKLKWVDTPAGRRLEFTNPKDSMVFLGDLSGPNWQDPAHPQNMLLRDALLDLKTHHPSQVDLILGNHEFNRLGFVRDNALIQQKRLPAYTSWLKERKATDTITNRVMFWGTRAYGVNKDGVPPPLEQYQKEMVNAKGRAVTIDEAARQFADDLAVGKNGRPNGKMLQYILASKESVVRDGYAFTHAILNSDNLGIVPLQAKKSAGGASWLRDREQLFFEPQLKKFINDVQNGRAPSSILPELGDARLDAVTKNVVHNADSISYTERAREGDQYRGVDQRVAKAFSEDTNEPVKGIFSGHKPAGDFVTAHRQVVGDQQFFDVAVDTSRGGNGMYATAMIKDDGRIVVGGKTSEGAVEHWDVGPGSDSLVGRVDTQGGYHIKGVTSDGRYILEKYNGFNLEQKIVARDSISPAQTSFSVASDATDSILQGKVNALKSAIAKSGGTVFENADEAARFVGNKFVIDMRGATSWSAVDDAKAKQIRQDLQTLADSLDPDKVVIITGGNRVGHANAVENIVQDVFGGPEAKKKFEILGFMKHDTPADEVDAAVKHVVLIGEGNNWDGPVQAAQKFVADRKGAQIIIGGGATLKRATETEAAAGMKDRMFLVQGFGGASQEQAAKGVAVSTANELVSGIKNLDAEAISNPIKTAQTMSADEVVQAFKAKGKKVVTFVGFSGDYEDKQKMLAAVKRVLQQYDPKTTIVNIGSTHIGIGEAYEVAHEMGFETAGIVSDQVKKYGGFSRYVDHIYLVHDDTWGGYNAATGKLNPTSDAMVRVSDKVVGVGGGPVAGDEMVAAHRQGIAVEYIQADMSHANAIKAAAAKNLPLPTDFRGVAYEKLEAQEPHLLPAKTSVRVSHDMAAANEDVADGPNHNGRMKIPSVLDPACVEKVMQHAAAE